MLDADTLRVVLEGGIGALAVLLGRDAITRYRNGHKHVQGHNNRSEDEKFKDKVERTPGISSACKGHETEVGATKTLAREAKALAAEAKVLAEATVARVTVLEGTDHD